MQDRIRAIVTEGRIQPLDDLSLPDGTEVLVTVLTNDDEFWLSASTPSLDAIWDNSEDDVYAELLKG
jgi:predicted DNA-binding antitoxin AbrB/MazE fold protein